MIVTNGAISRWSILFGILLLSLTSASAQTVEAVLRAVQERKLMVAYRAKLLQTPVTSTEVISVSAGDLIEWAPSVPPFPQDGTINEFATVIRVLNRARDEMELLESEYVALSQGASIIPWSEWSAPMPGLDLTSTGRVTVENWRSKIVEFASRIRQYHTLVWPHRANVGQMFYQNSEGGGALDFDFDNGLSSEGHLQGPDSDSSATAIHFENTGRSVGPTSSRWQFSSHAYKATNDVADWGQLTYYLGAIRGIQVERSRPVLDGVDNAPNLSCNVSVWKRGGESLLISSMEDVLARRHPDKLPWTYFKRLHHSGNVSEEVVFGNMEPAQTTVATAYGYTKELLELPDIDFSGEWEPTGEQELIGSDEGTTPHTRTYYRFHSQAFGTSRNRGGGQFTVILYALCSPAFTNPLPDVFLQFPISSLPPGTVSTKGRQESVEVHLGRGKIDNHQSAWLTIRSDGFGSPILRGARSEFEALWETDASKFQDSAVELGGKTDGSLDIPSDTQIGAAGQNAGWSTNDYLVRYNFPRLRQIMGGDVLVDISHPTSYKKILKFYWAHGIGAKVDGYYPVTGDPFKTIEIKNPTASETIAGFPTNVGKLQVVEDGQVFSEVQYESQDVVVNEGGDEMTYTGGKWTLRTGPSATNFSIARVIETDTYAVEGKVPWRCTTEENSVTSVVALKCEPYYTPSDVDRPIFWEAEYGPETPTAASPRRKVVNEWHSESGGPRVWTLKKATYSGDPNWELNGTSVEFDADQLLKTEQLTIFGKTHVNEYAWDNPSLSKWKVTSKLNGQTYRVVSTHYKKPALDAQFLTMERSSGEAPNDGPVTIWTFAGPTAPVPWETSQIIHPGGYRETSQSNLVLGEWVTLEKEGWGEAMSSGTQTVTTRNRFGGLVSKVVGTSSGLPLQSAVGSGFTPWGAPRQLIPLRGPVRSIAYVETAGPAYGLAAESTDPYALNERVTTRDWLGRPVGVDTGFSSITLDYSNPLKSMVTTPDGVVETDFNMFGEVMAYKDTRGSGKEADFVPGTAMLKADGRQVELNIQKIGQVAGVNSGLGQRGGKVSIDVELGMFCITSTSLRQDNDLDYSVKTYYDQEGRVKKVDHHPSGQEKLVEEWNYDEVNRTTIYQPSGAPNLKRVTESLSADGSTLTCTVEGGASRRYIKSEQGGLLVLVTEVKDDSDDDADQDTWNQLSRKSVNPSTGEIASTAWDLENNRHLVTDPVPGASVTVAPTKEGNPDDPKVEFENGRAKRMYGKKGGVQFDLNQWVYVGDRLEKVAGTVGGKSTGVEFDSSGRLKRAWGPGYDKTFVPSGTTGQTITVTDAVQNTTQTLNISQVGDFTGLFGDGVFPLTANTSDQGGGVTATSVNGSVTVSEERNRLVTSRHYPGLVENIERHPDGSVKKYGVGPEEVEVNYENGTITSHYLSDGQIEESRYKVGLRSQVSGPHGDKRQARWKRGRLSSENHVGGTWNGASVSRQQNGAGEINAVNVNIPGGSFSQNLIKDGHGRPWLVSGSEGFTGTYHYDPVSGQLDTFIRGPLTTTWTRDELGRIDQVTTKIDATSIFSYDHDYNAKNLRTRRIASGAGTSWTGLTYDSQHRLTDATCGSARSYVYDARGNRLTGGSVAEAWSVNGLDQVTGRTLGQRGYGVAGTVAQGARVKVYHPLSPEGEELAVDPQSGHYSAYWGVGGSFGSGGVSRVEILVRGTLEGAGAAGTDAVADKRLWVSVQAAVESFEYDGAGRLVGDSSWVYEWDGLGNLIGMERKAAAITDPTVSSEVLSFRYDADGRRVRKLRTVGYAAGGSRIEETRMLWDGWLPVYDERSLNGTVVSKRKFLWGRDISGGWDSAGGIGGLVAIQEVGGRTLLPVDDGLGNIMALVDSSTQAIVATYDHGPFGELIGITGEPDACPFLYQSKLFDSETGLYYFGYRYYSPRLGRWLSRDPLSEKGGVNLYAYCVNDPVNKHDFLGRKPELYWTDNLSDSAFIDACGQPRVNYWDWSGSNWLAKGWNAIAGGSATIESRTPTQDELARFFRRDSNGSWRVASVNEYKEASWAQFGESLPGEMQDAMGAIRLVMNFHYGCMALASGGIILVEGAMTVGTIVAAGHEIYAGVSMLTSVATGDDYAKSPAGAVAGLCGASEGTVAAIDLITGFGSNVFIGRGRVAGNSNSSNGASGAIAAKTAPETFYRSMSQAHYDQLLATGKLPATAETFISPTKAFAANYDGVLVQFNVRGGTTNALQGIGVRDASALTGQLHGGLPGVSKGWTSTNAFFKAEGTQVNIGLGRGAGLDTFNSNILNFQAIPK